MQQETAGDPAHHHHERGATMIARIQKSMKHKDGGFTLIELLVVMIIIGILAAIAIPVFLNQRKKAQDTAAKADISTIGKEVATYYVDNTGAPPAISLTGTGAARRYSMATTPPTDLGRVSVEATGVTNPPATATSADWCVGLAYTGGANPSVKYSANNGLQIGTC